MSNGGGPTPKPTALKQLQGTYRPDRDQDTGAGLPDTLPRCPAWLGKTAKAEWRRIAGQLQAAGMLKTVDRAALAAFAHAYGEFVELTIDLRNEPSTFTTDTGYIAVNPKVKQAQSFKREMLQWARELGLTPSARGRIVIDPRQPKEKTLAEELFDIMNSQQ